MKVLLWVLVAFAIAMWLTYGKKQRVRAARDNAPPTSTPPRSGEAMVCCAHCGTYFPASESVTLPSGIHFCCEEHRMRHSPPGPAA